MSDPLSRRDFLGAFSRETALDRARQTFARERAPLRPPGAVNEFEFLSLCDSCGECAEACPHASIFVMRSDDVGDGTPLLAPDERACHLCAELWCVAACEPGALRLDDARGSNWGHVELLTEHCFTFRGPECGACGGLCPGALQAIEFKGYRPFVDFEACIGCGLCVEACPTTPKALRFVPRSLRAGGPS